MNRNIIPSIKLYYTFIVGYSFLFPWVSSPFRPIISLRRHAFLQDRIEQKSTQTHVKLFMSSNVESHEEKLLNLQQSYTPDTSPETISAKDQYSKVQEDTFNKAASFFASEESVPEEVQPALRGIAKRFMREILESRYGKESNNRDGEEMAPDSHFSMKNLTVLDVGCGTGGLFEYLLEAADSNGISLNIVGLDLCSEMLVHAKTHGNQLIRQYGDHHTIAFVKGEFIDFMLQNNGKDDDFCAKFDGVIMNAVFGNMWDLGDALKASTMCLKNAGILSITHPLGLSFQQKLHESNPNTVKHVLPNKDDFYGLCRFQPLEFVSFEEGDQVSNPTADDTPTHDDTYYASFRRVPHAALPKILRYRGMVDSGYGRGGKKLGIPTANLPESQFAFALENVTLGVYFGWALIEDPSKSKVGRNMCHKAVVNVGYSPTFAGSENKEKIIEAHVILDNPVVDIEGDFYNETLRLALSGFLREEKKFQSFNELISQIRFDIECAKNALSISPYEDFKNDPFLDKNIFSWIGKDGGDINASWEYVEQNLLVDEISGN